MQADLIVEEIVALNKEDREELARLIRTNADALNAVNGIAADTDSVIPDEPGFLSGTVSDEAFNPIEGVEVEAIGEEGEEIATTNAAGQYEMVLTSGNYAVSYQKEGYEEHIEEVIIISDAGSIADVQMNAVVIPPPVE